MSIRHTQAASGMSLNDLLSLDGTAFLQAAYEVILQRDIDGSGQTHYSRKMRSGARKYDVISTLARSAEARRIGAVVPGLKKYLRKYFWADLPVLGWIARSIYGVESNDPVSRQIRALQMQFAVGGLGAGYQGGRSISGVVSQSFLGSAVEPASELDATLRDDLSPETIAIYALLKSPA